MTDKYRDFANSGVGKKIVGMLGLPRPPLLERYRTGEGSAPVIAGPVVLGAHAGGALLDALARMLGGMKLNVFTHGRNQEWIGAANRAGLMSARLVLTPASGSKVKALVFDASGIDDSSGLDALYHFFHDTLRSLSGCGRILVLGRPPESCTSPRKATAQRALEGLTRSLGKEVGRGCTAQLVYVAEGAESDIESTLRFFLSPRSAYVSAQVVRIAGARNVSAPQDWQRPLLGQTALVTGASRGIGTAIAQVLAREGAQVICLDIPQAEDALQDVARQLGGSALALDITAADAPQKIADAVRGMGGLDIIVHNAGITRDKRLANMKEGLWTSVVDVNLGAQERINDALLVAGAIKPSGRIVCVSSISGIAGNTGQTNYATSKAGVIGMVQSMSMAPVLRDRSITINAVAPGFIETQMTDAMPFLTRTVARMINSMNQGGQPEDVAETIAWLASPASVGLTGNVVRVCGQSLIGA